MQNAHVLALDIRDLRLLAEALETRSITRGGEAFGLSQPAASRTIAKLRRAFSDPLLVRSSGGLTLTPRAERLRQELPGLLAGLDRITALEGFDPAACTRRFRIASTDYGTITVLPGLLRALTDAAPRASIDVEPWSKDTFSRLEHGEIDAALYADAPLPPGFLFRNLFEDDYSVVFDPRKLTAERLSGPFTSLRRAVLLYPEGRGMLPDDPLGGRGYGEDAVAITVPYFASLPIALVGTSLVAVLPTRAAALLAGACGLSLRPLASAVPGFSYRILWHRRTEADLASIWFRNLAAQVPLPPQTP